MLFDQRTSLACDQRFVVHPVAARAIAGTVTMPAERKMTGRGYLRLQWTSWALSVVCVFFIAMWTTWWIAALAVVWLLYGIRINLTSGRRIAARMDAKRERNANHDS